MIAPANNVEQNRATVEQYVADVLDGRLVTGVLEQAACQRYRDDLRLAEGRGLYLDEQAGSNAVDFFPLLNHTQGEWSGQPFVLAPIQAFIVWNLFGWRRKSDGMRRFREAFLSFGRGNGKTPLGAGLIIKLVAFDDPPMDRATGYLTATKKDQAATCFSDITAFIERSGLDEVFQVFSNRAVIPHTGSIIEPLSSDYRVADSLRIHALGRDELHAWTDFHRQFYGKLETALGKFPQPMAITTTTAGTERSRIWRQQHNIAKQVLDRKNPVNIDTLFAMICEIDDDDDELDEKCWAKANPLMRDGVVKIEHLRQLAQKARLDSDRRHDLRRFHCNKLTTSTDKSITSAMWAASSGIVFPREERTPHGGVDLGWKDDLATIGYVFPLDTIEIAGEWKRRYRIEADVWIPRGCKRDLSRSPWVEWIRDGLIHVTDSEWTDTGAMYAGLRGRIDEHGIRTLAYDPNNAREFALNCVNVLGIEVFAFGQTHSRFNEPLSEFKIALAEGRIDHGDNPLLAWCAMNMVDERNSKGHRMPSKEKSEDKIDPIVALLMGLSEVMFAERVSGPSWYEQNEPELV